MDGKVSTSTRVLGLLIELLGAERPRTKTQLRRLPGYVGLGDAAFESQFQRDKAALREAGVILEIVNTGAESYRVDPASFQSSQASLDATDVALIQLAVSAWQSAGQDLYTIGPKIAASSSAQAEDTPLLPLGLEGAETVARIVEAIEERRVIGFDYRSESGSFERAVEPWKLIIRGRALYLWGRDLDREDERVFRLSRFRSEVEFLGEAQDAAPMPKDLEDPFRQLMVSPVMALRSGGAQRVRAFLESVHEADEDGWERAIGEPGEKGEWISRILNEGEDIVLLEPEELREELYQRLVSAAQWGSHA